jgi:WD40 repeat protein
MSLQLRASYSVIDHRERYMGAIGLTFDLDGSSIYCGYENMIQVFDTTRPGQATQRISTTPTRKSRGGQKGIISCLAFSPDYSGLLAAGSYSKNIGLYDAATGELCSHFGDLDGGVTQVCTVMYARLTVSL